MIIDDGFGDGPAQIIRRYSNHFTVTSNIVGKYAVHGRAGKTITYGAFLKYVGDEDEWAP